MEGLLDAIAALSLVLIVLVLASVRRAHIRVEYSVSWLLAAVLLLLLSRSEFVISEAARFIGIADPAVALLLLAGSVFLVVFFRFSMIISRLRDDNVALAQKLAILEYRLEKTTAR